MKRGFYTLVGIVLGLLLALPFQALSDSLVGKQVDMIAPVKLDGEYLDVEAIGIKGTTYAPVRAFAESLGMDVDWIDGEVIIETPIRVGEEVAESPNEVNIIDRITILEEAIESGERTIETYRTIIEYNNSINAPIEANQEMEEAISRMEQQIAEYEQILENLRAQQTPEEALQE